MSYFGGNPNPYWLGQFPPNSNFTNLNTSSINGYQPAWVSTLSGIPVSTFVIDGPTSTTPYKLFDISFPMEGDFFVTLKTAFTKTVGGLAQDSHGTLLINGGGLPVFPAGNFGMAALPTINDNSASTFTTTVTNIQVSGVLQRAVYYYDGTGNNYIASLITDVPVLHYTPPKI